MIQAFIADWDSPRTDPYTLLRQLGEHCEVTLLKAYDVPFSVQWEEAVNRFTGDIFLWVMADAKLPFDVSAMFNTMYKIYSTHDVGMYAPNLDWTSMTYDCSKLKEFIPKSNIYEVPGTDLIFVSLSADLLETLPPLDNNRHGWLYDYLIASVAEKMGLAVLRDYNFTIDHPYGKAYSEIAAQKQAAQWFDQLAPAHQRGIREMQCLKSIQS
jgi:hypothetical protein